MSHPVYACGRRRQRRRPPLALALLAALCATPGEVPAEDAPQPLTQFPFSDQLTPRQGPPAEPEEPQSPPVEAEPVPRPEILLPLDPHGDGYLYCADLSERDEPTSGLQVATYAEARELASEEDLPTAVSEAPMWLEATVGAWEALGFRLVSRVEEARIGEMRAWWAYLVWVAPENRPDEPFLRSVEVAFYSTGPYLRRVREFRAVDPEVQDILKECRQALEHPEWTDSRREWVVRQVRKDRGPERVDALLRALSARPTVSDTYFRWRNPGLEDFGPDPLETGPESDEMKQALSGILSKLCAKHGIPEQNVSAGICDPITNEFALHRGDQMRYSGCVVKILILLTAFEEEAAGRLVIDSAMRLKMAKMLRESSMPEAGELARKVGLQRIKEVAMSPKYRLYVPGVGGLWHGRAFWGGSNYFQRDPVANLTHGVTARQAMRFYWLLDHGRLVSPEASERMKMIFLDNRVGILCNKCVKGIWGRGLTIIRKSGWYDKYANDTLLVTGPDRHYIMVCLVTSYNSEGFLQDFGRMVDDYFIERSRRGLPVKETVDEAAQERMEAEARPSRRRLGTDDR